MIPKIIHYCWFGKGKYPTIVKKCITSWEKYCPYYKIKLWNEENYDISKNNYAQEAYRTKKWAFVSDFVRLDIIYREGGIYLDTDVEILRPLDSLLMLDGFVASDEYGINTGVGFGAAKHNYVIKRMLDMYANRKFLTPSGPDLTPCTFFNTQWFIEQGYKPKTPTVEKYKGVVVFPAEYFSPIRGADSKTEITANTYAIHWGSRLWETGMTRFKAKVRMYLGIRLVQKIKSLLRLCGYKNRRK